MWEKNWLMSFNPDKCEVIRITNKRKTINAQYSIHGQVLQMTDKAKYLGITIDSKISWGPHINNITKKATNTLASLRRNISSCPRNIRETSYKSLVRPQVEYASTVWDTSIKSQAAAVEAVQRRAARYIMGDYRQESSVTAMLQQLQLDSLQTRRLRARATMMYRVVNHLIAIPSAPLQPAQNITRGHTKRFIQPACNIRCYSWYSSLGKSMKKKLQIMQNKVIRFFLDLGPRSRITCDILESVNMLHTSDRVTQLRLNHVFNIFNGNAPTYLYQHFVRNDGITRGATNMNYLVPRVGSQGIFNFYYNAIRSLYQSNKSVANPLLRSLSNPTF